MSETAVLVREGDGQTVDLRLERELQPPGREPGLGHQLRHPGMPGHQFVLILGVGQREHGLAMSDLPEGGQRLPTHTLRGRVGRDQLGVALLEGTKLPIQRVVVGVEDLRAIEDVVAVVMPTDQGAKLVHPAGDILVTGRHVYLCSDPPEPNGSPSPRSPGARPRTTASSSTVCAILSGSSACNTCSENTPQVTPTDQAPADRAA